MGKMYNRIRDPFQEYMPDELKAWFMRLNHLQRGFLILLIAALQVTVLVWISTPSNPPAQFADPVTLATIDSSTVDPSSGIYVNDSLLDGEEPWEDKVRYSVDVKPTYTSPLSRFFTALQDSKEKKKNVRIAYFGDSMIEGDLITQSLRKDLQQMFGGKGVGFVPIFSEIPGFRKTIRHRIGNWKYYNYFKPIPPGLQLGISGEVFLAAEEAALKQTWVKYKATDLYPGTEIFEQVKLYYGRPEEGATEGQPNFEPYVIVTTDSGETKYALNQDEMVNELLISADPTEEVNLNFKIPDYLPVYGLSVESKGGIFVDNFPSRSNSGTNLIKIPGSVLESFSKHLDYDLIVLQFGLNVVSTRRKSYKSYEEGMKKVVEHFQRFMPETDILIVSVTDKSSRVNGVMQTDPSVPLIVDAQRRVAEEMHIGFLNLYEGMGGKNSMIRWVKAKPSLARSDYAHPNHRGAEKVSNIVKDYLLEKFNSFAQDHPRTPVVGSPISMK